VRQWLHPAPDDDSGSGVDGQGVTIHECQVGCRCSPRVAMMTVTPFDGGGAAVEAPTAAAAVLSGFTETSELGCRKTVESRHLGRADVATRHVSTTR
jgi:hypothetical protein